MADSKIKDLLQKINDGSKHDEVKLDLHKAQLDYWAKSVGLAVAVIGIVLTIISLTGINKLPEEKTFIYLYLGTAAFVFFIIFATVLYFQITRITDQLAKNYADFKTVLETFIYLEDTYNLKIINLGKQISIAEATAKNIANAPLSNLISWNQSGKLELEASRVFAISIDLSWVNNQDKLEEIFMDLRANPDDKYFYIVTSNSETALKNINDINTFLAKEIQNNPEIKYKERFKIIKLIDLEKDGCKIFPDGNFTLPIPNDIVIYKKITAGRVEKTAVISTQTITKTNQRSADELDNNYDVKFTDHNAVSRIELWFKRTWEEITTENISNE
ncbi:MAG: hypothetical protein JWN78_2006 [Bacteroidota bacterium]|nr:hypothetical protein [Bacteroidota bacterium]